MGLGVIGTTPVSSPRRLRAFAATCARKVRHETWEDARLAGLAVWRENPRPSDANMPLPYPCGDHYHCGHIRTGIKESA